jgi:hypothetical protein
MPRLFLLPRRHPPASPSLRSLPQDEPVLSLLRGAEHWPVHPTSRDNVTVLARFTTYGPPLANVALQYEWAERNLDTVKVSMRYDHSFDVCTVVESLHRRRQWAWLIPLA